MSAVTEGDVDRLLTQLGDTADDVAQTLLTGGYLGRRDDCANCPVAKYLRASGVYDAWVDQHEVTSGIVGQVTLPKPVILFVQEFDSFGYPDLIEGAAP